MEGGACLNGFTVEQAEKAFEILRIIFEHPFVIEVLFRKGELGEGATHRYMWSVVSDEEIKKVKEFFADGKRD